MSEAGPKTRSPWAWIPTLYLAEGLPYVVVMTLSVIMYKGLGLSNTDIAFYTSWLYLPWVIKPLWSPVVDLLGTRRRWIWATQLVVAVALAGVALTLPGPHFLRWTLAFFWLLAFDSATHDIAADGFYMLALAEKEQAFFVGVRSTFYRLAMIAGQGLLVMLAGGILGRTGDPRLAWSVALGVLAAAFLLFGLWHRFVLPRPAADRPGDAREVPRFVQGVPRPPSARSSASRASPSCCSSCCSTASARRSSSRWWRRSCSTRAPRAGWGSPPPGRLRLRHGRAWRAGAGRHPRRLGGVAARAQGLAVADAADHPPARRGLPLPRLRPAGEPAPSSRPAWRSSSSATASASPPTCST